jgi:hypothetical protein
MIVYVIISLAAVLIGMAISVPTWMPTTSSATC